MSIEEIQKCLDEAWHELGHATSFVGAGRYLAAEMAAGRALDLTKKAHEALYNLQG
jgi:hypothetical protein